MSHEDPGSVSYSEIGGLSEQIRELREVKKKTSASEVDLIWCLFFGCYTFADASISYSAIVTKGLCVFYMFEGFCFTQL